MPRLALWCNQNETGHPREATWRFASLTTSVCSSGSSMVELITRFQFPRSALRPVNRPTVNRALGDGSSGVDGVKLVAPQTTVPTAQAETRSEISTKFAATRGEAVHEVEKLDAATTF